MECLAISPWHHGTEQRNGEMAERKNDSVASSQRHPIYLILEPTIHNHRPKYFSHGRQLSPSSLFCLLVFYDPTFLDLLSLSSLLSLYVSRTLPNHSSTVIIVSNVQQQCAYMGDGVQTVRVERISYEYMVLLCCGSYRTDVFMEPIYELVWMAGWASDNHRPPDLLSYDQDHRPRRPITVANQANSVNWR